MKPVVFIMAKAPRMGLAKTRLARRIGWTAAWRINRALHALTLRAALGDPRWRVVLAAAPDPDVKARFGGLWPARVVRTGQGDGDLGARMGRLMRDVAPAPVMFIGTDCPGLVRADLAAAVRALRRADGVIGPAGDGGYWLLGLRTGLRPRPPFAGVRWSGPHAAADTLANLAPNARIVRLRQLADLD